MYSRMLIALDRSKLAEQVLPYARYLAKALALSRRALSGGGRRCFRGLGQSGARTLCRHVIEREAGEQRSPVPDQRMLGRSKVTAAISRQ
jgi:hypothetical protein